MLHDKRVMVFQYRSYLTILLARPRMPDEPLPSPSSGGSGPRTVEEHQATNWAPVAFPGLRYTSPGIATLQRRPFLHRPLNDAGQLATRSGSRVCGPSNDRGSSVPRKAELRCCCANCVQRTSRWVLGRDAGWITVLEHCAKTRYYFTRRACISILCIPHK